MNWGKVPTGALLGWVLFAVGCASTRYEAPPEVVEQPPEITAAEAMAAGEEAEQQVEAEAQLQGEAEAVAAGAASDEAMLVASTAPSAVRPRRSRPTDRSIDDIRSQHDGAPYALDFNQRLDAAHDELYTWMQGVVQATDHRFAAKDRELKPVPAAPFRISLTTETINRSDGLDFGLDANLDMSLSLPNIEDRLRIFVTSNELDESANDSRNNSRLRAGVRYSLLDSLDFDVGVQLDLPPVAFASVSWRREYALGGWDFYPLAKVFMETDESFGYVTAATFDRWSGRHLFRSSTYAKWRDDRDKTQWSQSFIYARAHELIVPERYGYYLKADDIGHGWGVRVLASGEDTSEVTYYETGVFYRRPVARHKWLYWYVEPLVRWDRKYDWNTDPGIRVGIDMLFWDLARPPR